ncbi:acetyl-CoA hydrolase/transferase family protein [Desulfatirhabdium butyrativorans]|uniref:acetyl-CoA hydrolase/transferase family protein n=1 Tax=Desulfatirhabdium butyrativorans TaxID=340467 RepID=UPI0003F4BE54|nr:acetyl-CoA hydrolase/transferase C-terminal domain-containing protein [Desulfatirhabdium butyrativorans]
MSPTSIEKEYHSKRISVDEAAALVRSGMSIHLGGAANVAALIDEKLARRAPELRDVTVRTYIDTHPYRMCETDPEGESFHWFSGFVLGFSRAFSRRRGIGIYIPSSWHNVPAFIRDTLSFDIFYLVTPPMTDSGFFNFGLTAGETMAIADVSKTIVAVVRKDMPTVLGGFEECLPLSRIDYVVEDNETHTFCLPPVETTKADHLIAENILNAGLIQDGTTLQIGIGGLPNSVLELIRASGLRNLGLHTEMLTEKMMDLIEAGVVNNSQKCRDRFKTVFTFCLGSRKLYDFVDRNPLFATYPVNYTNHPMVIAEQPRMFSLNSAAQVDLTGQVASEQIGGPRPFQISGTGGQLDFVMGTMFARDGKGVSVIALYSEYNGASKIVPLLERGTNVTVPRSMVDHVATEWGVARLRGLTIQERALALIAIAHPRHRDELARQARNAGLIPYPVAECIKPKGVIVQRG